MPESDPAVSAASEADFALGRTALAEIADPATVGLKLGSQDEGDGVVSVFFRADMLGYPGWRWTATIAHLDGQPPSVLETELTPGDGALLAPDWVPWVDRMTDYRAAQDAADSDDDDSDDTDGLDPDDLDGDDLESEDLDSDDPDADDPDADDFDGGADDDDSDDDDSDDESPGTALLHAGDLDGVDIDDLDDSVDEEPQTLER
jgi:hypothetical protein